MAVEGFMEPEDIPFGIVLESPNAFSPTSGMRDHPHMHEDDLPRRNIRHLLHLRQTTAADAAVASGIGQSWVSRYLSGKISKPNPEKLGLLAAHLGVSASDLMWRDLTATDRPVESQPVGSERAIVEAAVKLVRELEAMSPEPSSPGDLAERLFVAMKVVRDEGANGILDDSNVIVALRRFAAELRKTG
ncbi:helix-turn-helix transcriptional regulator [Stenotrophomonas sp. ATCM1_4]|uniref:helix-turn-helix domain-containing protein n=1 Tax=Stenotrophomonas sp. ATCM1_4 TaxID=2259330 RepID=UPI001404E1BD|nr:helix-turn-helix transcriptional regulator [Stenotrophomonas sp. ATCM1_4]